MSPTVVSPPHTYRFGHEVHIWTRRLSLTTIQYVCDCGYETKRCWGWRRIHRAIHDFAAHLDDVEERELARMVRRHKLG